MHLSCAVCEMLHRSCWMLAGISPIHRCTPWKRSDSGAAPKRSCHAISVVKLPVISKISSAGPRSTRRTKLICTIGPASCSKEALTVLAANGMNVARLNMCHGSHDWHREVISHIRQLNKSKGCAHGRMMWPGVCINQR